MNQVIEIQKSGPLFEQPEAVIQEGTDRFITEVTALLENAVKSITPVGVFGAQGGLLSTIHGETVDLGTPSAMGIVGHQSPYGDVIEMGRRPGGKMPPEGSLIRWIEVVLGADENTAKRLEFPIRRKIAQKGFAGAMMFEMGLEMSKEQIAAIAEKCGIGIAYKLGGGEA